MENDASCFKCEQSPRLTNHMGALLQAYTATYVVLHARANAVLGNHSSARARHRLTYYFLLGQLIVRTLEL